MKAEANSLPKVLVKLTGPGRGTVVIDGQEIRGVVEVRVRAGVGCVNRLTMAMKVGEVEVEGEMEVTTMAHQVKEFKRGLA